jgi:transposase
MARKKGVNASEKERKRVISLRMLGHSINDVAKILGRSKALLKLGGQSDIRRA